MITGCYIGRDVEGYYVEWCREMRNGSIRTQRWYGPKSDVEERAALPPDRTWSKVVTRYNSALPPVEGGFDAW